MVEKTETVKGVLDFFVERVLDEAAAQGMILEKRSEVKDSLSGELEAQIEQAMIEALPDAKLLELEAILSNGGEEEEMDGRIEQFFADAGIDYDGVVAQVLVKFREALLKDEGDRV